STAMANVWMHNGFLQVEGEKMSKSLGNFVTIHELRNKTYLGHIIWPGEVIRLAMLRTHYRQPIDWTARALEDARHKLNVWYHAVGDSPVVPSEPSLEVVSALSNDLNTHEAITYIDKLAGELRAIRSFNVEPPASTLATFKANANLLGFLCRTQSEYKESLKVGPQIDRAHIERMVAGRAEARAARDWAESDRLRDELAALGVAIKDNKDGTTSWEFKR
ncbi:MAG: cysteine--tRNA ligase, partial [Hyphomicrobiales bacterium]|nr:cysteine--tRNA ligase [Hyphomicrobiales bacterium]